MFEGKTILITGAAAGLGEAAADTFAQGGARLLLSDLSPGVEDVARRLDADWMIADAAKPEDHRALVARAVEIGGRLDVALNNAGIAHPPMRIEQTPEDLARRVIEVDLLGMFWALQAQIPQLQQQHRADGSSSCIVNVASIAGLVAAPTLGIYAAAKHGVSGLTRTAAIENARRGIRVNAICPAFTRTSMVDDIIGAAPDPAAATAELTRGVPMRRLAEREEIVTAILFAANPQNSFMTGQTLALDGGVTAY